MSENAAPAETDNSKGFNLKGQKKMKPEIIEKINEHYEHAKAKHPYFCNRLSYRTLYSVVGHLKDARDELEFNIRSGTVSFSDVLNCEIAEAEKEIVYGNTAAAVEECYDAIAVLLRMVDVLEGRQELGNPAKGATDEQ